MHTVRGNIDQQMYDADNAFIGYSTHHTFLDTLKYLHENGCPWSEDTCMHAIRFKQHECLKYAVDNGCPVSNKCYKIAIARGNVEVLKILGINEDDFNEFVISQ